MLTVFLSYAAATVPFTSTALSFFPANDVLVITSFASSAASWKPDTAPSTVRVSSFLQNIAPLSASVPFTDNFSPERPSTLTYTYVFVSVLFPASSVTTTVRT